jgi:hypothetical protein
MQLPPWKYGGVQDEFEGAEKMEATTVRHSQPVFFLVAVGWMVSVGGLGYMWHLLT